MELTYYKLQFGLDLDLTDSQAETVPILSLVLLECEGIKTASLVKLPWPAGKEVPGDIISKVILESVQEVVLDQLRRILEKDPVVSLGDMVGLLDRKFRHSLYVSKLGGPHAEELQGVMPLTRRRSTQRVLSRAKQITEAFSRSAYLSIPPPPTAVIRPSVYSLSPFLSTAPLSGGFADT